MGLEARQTTLENEMITAKDTIWRLTNRVVHLEKEFKILQNSFQNRIDSNKPSQKIKSIVSPSKSGKLAEIAGTTQKNSGADLIQSNDGCDNDDLGNLGVDEHVVVKQEDISESDWESFMPDDENYDPLDIPDPGAETAEIATSPLLTLHESGDTNRRSSRTKTRPFKMAETDSNDSDSDHENDSDDLNYGDLTLSNSSSRGPRRSQVWNHFYSKKRKLENGKERILAICKHCQNKVSPKSDRLRNHVKKCLSSTKGKSVGRVQDASVDDLETGSSMAMECDSNPAFKDAIQKSLEKSLEKSPGNPLGQKPKGIVWQHYVTVQTQKPNGKIRIHAICKRCKKEVSPKSDRLKIHVAKCNISQTDSPQQIKPHDVINTNATSPEETVTMDVPLATESELEEASVSKQQTASIETSEALSANVDLVEGSNFSGITKGPVWQHFSTTVQTTDGHSRIVATCNLCQNTVSPKSERLKKHMQKLHGIVITKQRKKSLKSVSKKIK